MRQKPTSLPPTPNVLTLFRNIASGFARIRIQ
jgi:hypothetical protein